VHNGAFSDSNRFLGLLLPVFVLFEPVSSYVLSALLLLKPVPYLAYLMDWLQYTEWCIYAEEK